MADGTPRTSFDPKRQDGMASTATPPRGHDANAPENPGDSGKITATAGLWIAFPVLMVVLVVVISLLVLAV